MGTTVIPRGNSTPILEPAKHDFYFVPLFIKLFVIGHRSFPTVSARNTRRDPFTGQGITKPVGIIASIRKKFPGLWQRSEQGGGSLVIAHLPAGQMERCWLTGGIANSMEF